MHLANRTHKWDRDVQEFHRVHGTADQSIERFAAGIPVLRVVLKGQFNGFAAQAASSSA
jgi:hypothetical protein